ncbi:MAG: FtsW/RodA/SpoVE family cell cycle protein [Patescibacteria group bacterium]|nr:FtsW/RodA/SpoVE family cell cycle protein [Candidatus Beckwithbacteria bacterium]MDZ4229363.1 FtsW/RodA/SpoVE family cell cycle protein [Patescibacteria group bacterium]
MIDWRLIGPLFPLFGLSLLILGGLSLPAMLTQALFIVLGLVLFFLVGRYPFEQHRLLSRYYLIAVVVLLLLPYIFGVATRGAIRWIPLGPYSLQPSELVKPLLIIVMADYLSRWRRGFNLKSFLVYLSLLLVPFALIFKQPDLGTSLVVAAIWLGLLLAARIPGRQLMAFLLLILLALPLGFKLLQPYQKQRLLSFTNPYADPAGSGYQVIQSLIAVGSGGWWGQGLGRGSQSQLQFLPENHTDFIFSAVAEELGLLAAALLILSYWWLLRRLLEIAKNCSDEFGRLLVTGVLAMFWFQTGVTIGMNLGLMPVTGITLPLVSSGGSSLLGTMVSLGLVSSVGRGNLLSRRL